MELKTEIENIKECLAGYVGGVHAQAYAAIEFLESELETLRASNGIKQEYGEFVNCNREDLLKFEIDQLKAENAKLIAERDGFEESYRNLFNKRSLRVVHLMDAVDKRLSEINCTEDIRQTVYESIRLYGCGEVADLKLKIELLEAEREAMMKQPPYGYVNPNDEWNLRNKGYAQIQPKLTDYSTMPLFRGPLPAQQIPEITLPLIEEALVEYFGRKCLDYDADCKCCQVWRQFEALQAKQINILDMGMDQPASMRRCVQKLIEAAGILLEDKNYDGTGHELISDARNNAIKYLADHKPVQQIPEGYALEILRKVFDLYESGADYYDSDDHYSAAYLGRCIRLDDDLFKSCVDLLSASQPKGDV